MWTVTLVAVTVLAGAPLGWPGWYYTLLRLCVATAGVVGVYRFWRHENTGWPLGYGAVAVLFNPVFPVYLRSKDSWLVADAVAALFLLLGAVSYRRWVRARAAAAEDDAV